MDRRIALRTLVAASVGCVLGNAVADEDEQSRTPSRCDLDVYSSRKMCLYYSEEMLAAEKLEFLQAVFDGNPARSRDFAGQPFAYGVIHQHDGFDLYLTGSEAIDRLPDAGGQASIIITWNGSKFNAVLRGIKRKNILGCPVCRCRFIPIQ